MKKLMLLAAALLACTPADAEPAPSRAAKQLYDQGFHDCAEPLDQAVKFAHADDAAYSYLDSWSVEDPNAAVGSALTLQQFIDGRAVNAISVVKNAAGKCDIVLTAVFPVLEKTCSAVLADSFKGWKRHEELEPLEVYQDPDMTGSTVAMSPLGLNGCLVVKHAVIYG
jgi:hypothetical protein